MPFHVVRSLGRSSVPSPNLIPGENNKPPTFREKQPRSKTKILSCFFILLLIIVTSCTTLIARSNNNFFVGIKSGFLVRQLSHFFMGGNNELRGEADDRINFLLLGIGGPGHEGPYLTDTIIFASYKPSTNEAALVSIPRDLIVPFNGYYPKINSVYALGLKKGEEAAFADVKKATETITGQPIHYVGVVDFNGFEKIIDTVGGVTVVVDKSFTDYSFPIKENHIGTVSFKAGEQKMDGSTALNYARSRHGNNNEGSDFARSKRQQKIILATKQKIATFGTLINPYKIVKLYSLINDYTRTDMEPWEMVKLAQMTRDVSRENITNVVLDDSPTGYLTSGISSLDGAFILQPKGGSYQTIQYLIKNVFGANQFKKEKPVLFIQNGTSIPSLASTISEAFAQAGLKPIATSNADKQNYASTVIYDYTDGKKPITKNYLESYFKKTALTQIPLELLSYTMVRKHAIKDSVGAEPELDFLVILGEDVSKNTSGEFIRTLTPDELKATTTPTSTISLVPIGGGTAESTSTPPLDAPVE